MNKFMILAALCLSGSAFAQMCEVDLVNQHGQVVQTYRSNDGHDACKEAMKSCRFEIRQRGRLGRMDCVRDNDRRIPVPQPMPVPGPHHPGPHYPTPSPIPMPAPVSRDAVRFIQNGESAIRNSRYVTVVGASMNGLYAVRSTDGWNTLTNGVRREELAVTSGCNLGICVNDSVINTSSLRYVTLVGLSYDNDMVTKSTDGWNTITMNVNRANLAETKGCVSSYYAQVCVGNQVVDQNNRYKEVVGVQMDGRVVLRSTDGWNTLQANVDVGNLVITR